MNDIQKLLDESGAPVETQQLALKLALQIASPLAAAGTGSRIAAMGDGSFLAFLMELLKVLLPILLQLLIPKTP